MFKPQILFQTFNRKETRDEGTGCVKMRTDFPGFGTTSLHQLLLKRLYCHYVIYKVTTFRLLSDVAWAPCHLTTLKIVKICMNVHVLNPCFDHMWVDCNEMWIMSPSICISVIQDDLLKLFNDCGFLSTIQKTLCIIWSASSPLR